MNPTARKVSETVAEASRCDGQTVWAPLVEPMIDWTHLDVGGPTEESLEQLELAVEFPPDLSDVGQVEATAVHDP